MSSLPLPPEPPAPARASQPQPHTSIGWLTSFVTPFNVDYQKWHDYHPGYALKQLVGALGNADSWYWGLIKQTATWSFTVEAWVWANLQRVWNDRVKPALGHTWTAVSRMATWLRDVGDKVVGGLGGLVHDYLGWQVGHIDRVRGLAQYLYDGVAALPTHFKRVTQAVETAFGQVELVAHGVAGILQSRLDAVVYWVNHSNHPLGVARESWIYWSVYAYVGTLWATLINEAVRIPPGPVTQQLLTQYPPVTGQTRFDRWLAGTYATSPGVTRALTRITTGQL